MTLKPETTTVTPTQWGVMTDHPIMHRLPTPLRIEVLETGEWQVAPMIWRATADGRFGEGWCATIDLDYPSTVIGDDLHRCIDEAVARFLARWDSPAGYRYGFAIGAAVQERLDGKAEPCLEVGPEWPFPEDDDLPA